MNVYCWYVSNVTQLKVLTIKINNNIIIFFHINTNNIKQVVISIFSIYTRGG